MPDANPILRDVSVPLPSPPYPADTTAGTYCLHLDHARIHQSNTWKLATSTAPELRPWLLMMWMEAWQRVPTGSMPEDDELIAAIIGMPLSFFGVHKRLLMRGWERHSDGLLYHRYLTGQALKMLRERKAWRTRQRHSRDSQTVDYLPVTVESRADVDLTLTKKRTSTAAPVDKSAAATTWAEHWKAQGKAFGIEAKQGESTGDYCRRAQAFAKEKAAK